MNPKQKRTLLEDWQMVRRAVKILHHIAPSYWICGILGAFSTCLTPHFSLYMSAQLLNELAGTCNLQKLTILAVITVTGSFLLSMFNRAIQRWDNVTHDLLWNQYHFYMLDVQNRFQYDHIENPEVILKKTEIDNRLGSTGSGLFEVSWSLLSLIENIFNLIISVSLTFSLFRTVKGISVSGIWSFVNSPFSALAIIALILGNAVASIRIANTETQKLRGVLSGLAKTNTAYYVFNRLSGPDMTIFNLHRIVLDYFEKYQLRPQWQIDYQKIEMRWDLYGLTLKILMRLVVFLFTAAKAFIGTFGIGNFILYQGTVEKFVSAVSSAATCIGRLRFNNDSLQEFFDYLDLPNDMYQGTLAVEKRDDIDYAIEFRDVSFKYPRTDTWALHHVNLKFKIGDKLAIVGENGSGKTTFIKLLCRLYDPTEGKILLNGIDITRYRYDEYMSLFSVVFQDYSLFSFSLAQNVAASPDIDEEKVRDCLIRAGLGDRLAALEQGIHTCIGRDYENNGVDFSGGELQKIALARALYKDAPFVILDEPTAALDPLAEAAVYENFNRIVQNKTAVFISHRLSSCRFCDNIAVFSQGQLVQEGSHDMLAADAGGKYAQLWNAQAQYYRK